MVDMDIATIVAEAVHLVPRLKVIWMPLGEQPEDASSSLDPTITIGELDITYANLFGRKYPAPIRDQIAGCPCIRVAEPKDIKSLFIVLHEIGHLVLDLENGGEHGAARRVYPVHAQLEKAASCWARQFLAKRGVSTPDEVWAIARDAGHFNSDCGQQE